MGGVASIFVSFLNPRSTICIYWTHLKLSFIFCAYTMEAQLFPNTHSNLVCLSHSVCKFIVHAIGWRHCIFGCNFSLHLPNTSRRRLSSRIPKITAKWPVKDVMDDFAFYQIVRISGIILNVSTLPISFCLKKMKNRDTVCLNHSSWMHLENFHLLLLLLFCFTRAPRLQHNIFCLCTHLIINRITSTEWAT